MFYNLFLISNKTQTFSGLSSSFFRKISTKIIIPSDVANEMFATSSHDSMTLVPNQKQIENHQQHLKKLYEVNSDFKKIGNNLFKNFNDPNVKSIALSFPQPPNSEAGRSVFFLPVLSATALFSGIGALPYYNDKGFPLFALVDKDSTNPILGHQDSMYYNPDDKESSLMKYLMLVNGFSQSKAVTWFKESIEILKELKANNLESYNILKDTFVIAKSKNPNEVESKTPFKIISENDELTFVSNFVYVPHPSLDSNSKIRFEKAVKLLKDIVNSKSNRHEFVLNQDEVQILFLKNLLGLHGRGPVEEDQEGLRKIIAIPLGYTHSSSSVQIMNSRDNHK